MKIALTIAGSDSGGGAGIQADLKTFHQFGVFGTSVVCAVTAQNTQGVRAWQALPPALVTEQLDALADDLPPQAVKRGMLGSADVAPAAAPLRARSGDGRDLGRSLARAGGRAPPDRAARAPRRARDAESRRGPHPGGAGRGDARGDGTRRARAAGAG